MNIIKKLFVNGKWSKLSKDVLADDVASLLPPPATAEDEGKVVSVTETGEYGLSTVESGLPVATSEDAGKVVAVGENGAYELAEASGGGGSILSISYTSVGYPPNQTITLSESWYTISEALSNNVFCIIFGPLGVEIVTSVTSNGPTNKVLHSMTYPDYGSGIAYYEYSASSEDGLPHRTR